MLASDWEIVTRWAIAISTVISAASAVYISWARRAFTSQQQFGSLEKRVSLVETTIKEASWKEIRDKLFDLDGDLKGMNATIESLKTSHEHLRTSMDSIQQFLLENK
ncbi:MAG TPA: hypothetical protein VMV27_04045 [Candidatus Binataceae bacterium]|nr:hypothetical protein [Candidatus Binataceae bacterium]